MRIRDKDGVEGMPLKLVIISLMISICAPVLAGAMRTYEEESNTVLLHDAVEKICSTAEEVFFSGPGNARQVNVYVPDGTDCYLLLGGESFSESISISIIEEGQEPERTYLTDPTIRLITPEPNGVIIEIDTLLTLRCVEVDGERCVEVLL